MVINHYLVAHPTARKWVSSPQWFQWINPTNPIYNWGYKPLTKWDEPPSNHGYYKWLWLYKWLNYGHYKWLHYGLTNDWGVNQMAIFNSELLVHQRVTMV